MKIASLGGMSHFFLLHSILAALVRHIYLIENLFENLFEKYFLVLKSQKDFQKDFQKIKYNFKKIFSDFFIFLKSCETSKNAIKIFYDLGLRSHSDPC